jgi:hypothetical protein
MAHHLGEHVKRTGEEFPGIVGGVLLRVPAGKHLAEGGHEQDADDPETEGVVQQEDEHLKYTPHRLMWPSYWAAIQDGQVTALNPEEVYEIVRRPLRTREFTEDLADVSRELNLSKRKELMGEDRARAKPEDWTEEEQAIIAEAEAVLREKQVHENMHAALQAIEEAYPGTQAVYISGGEGFVRAAEEETSQDGEQQAEDQVGAEGEDAGPKIVKLEPELLGQAAAPYAWPMAHNVRPAQQSLGVTGCLECHSDGALIFQTEVQPVGLLPDQQTVAAKAHELQDADMVRLTTWNQLFAGRSLFKIAGLAALGLAGLITVCAMAINLGTYWRRSS